MADKDCTSQPPPAEPLCLVSVTQPYPRSPNTTRKPGSAFKYSEEQLSHWLEILEQESKKTEAHMASLKKRQANLATSAEVMAQQVREHFEAMRHALEKDELSVLNSIEQEHRENNSRLNRVLQDWNQHLKLVRKHMATIKKLQESGAESQQQVSSEDFSTCHKKQDVSEFGFKLNEEKFKKLMKVLEKISKDLHVQLQKKSLLLDWTEVIIDETASHRQIKLSSGGRRLHLSPDDGSPSNHPLQFDQIYCALGSPAITAGQHYWEVDVHCCAAWVVGIACGNITRKGQEKSTKLGRNRLSWSLEFRDGHLSAWHNDRHVALDRMARAGHGMLGKVGVFVNYPKGRLAFYDADTMKTLQEFSTSCTAVFEKANHQFTGAVFPAFRFLKYRDPQAVPDHIKICDLSF